MSAHCRPRRWSNAQGQSIVEFAFIVPVVLLTLLGVVEGGYALLDQQVVTKFTREGSNLISRDTTIEDAITALKNMSSRPINLTNGSKVIFSVIKRGATVGTANYDKLFLYQRCEYGSASGASKLSIAGGGSFHGAPDYEAFNADTNAGLQITNVPSTLVTAKGGMAYVTEVYSKHTLITPLDRLGITMPTKLYSIAYF